MFLLMGISSKVRNCGRVGSGTCPACGRTGLLHVCHQYMTPHVFFIPTFRFHSRYVATCGACASVLELDKEKGRGVARGLPVEILPEDLHLIQNNSMPLCPHCGGRLHPKSAFCSKCGGRIL